MRVRSHSTPSSVSSGLDPDSSAIAMEASCPRPERTKYLWPPTHLVSSTRSQAPYDLGTHPSFPHGLHWQQRRSPSITREPTGQSQAWDVSLPFIVTLLAHRERLAGD